MKYPYRRTYRGSALKVRILAQRRSFIEAIESYITFPANAIAYKPSLEITLFLSSERALKKVPVRSSKVFYSANVKKNEIRLRIPQELAEHGPLDRNDLFFRPLSFFLHSFGYHAIHASLVHRKGTFCFFAGPGGRGKSTLACLLSLSGFQLLGDDMVFVGRSKWGFEFLPLRTRAKIDHPEKKSFIDVGSIRVGDMPAFSRRKKIFFLFPRYDQKNLPELRPMSKKEGILRLISDNMTLKTGHPDNRGAKIRALDFICGLGDNALFFEVFYNDENLPAVSKRIRKLERP